MAKLLLQKQDMRQTLEHIRFVVKMILKSSAKFPDRLIRIGKYVDFSMEVLLQLLELIEKDKRDKGPKNRGFGLV